MGWHLLSDLVGHLPPGCALFRAMGGPAAWSQETTVLLAVEHRLRVLAWMRSKDGEANRNQPKPIEPPPLAGEASATDTAIQRRAEAYLKRTGVTHGG